MTKNKKLTHVISLISPLVIVALSAQATFAGSCDTNTALTIWNCNGDGDTGAVGGLIISIFNWVAAGVIAAVFIGVVYGSFLYITSNGNAQKAKSGINTIGRAIGGLIAYFLLWSFINYLIPGGLFS